MSSPAEIEARFVLQREEFIKARRLAVRNLPRQVKWAGWVQCGLLLALMLTGLAYRPSGELPPVSLVVVVLVWLVFLTGQITQRAIVNLQFARMVGAEIWYKFDEMGFRCGMPNSEGRLDWPGIANVIETDTLFVIVEFGILFYTIPKRAFAADEVSSLQQLLAERVRAYSRERETKRCTSSRPCSLQASPGAANNTDRVSDGLVGWRAFPESGTRLPPVQHYR